MLEISTHHIHRFEKEKNIIKDQKKCYIIGWSKDFKYPYDYRKSESNDPAYKIHVLYPFVQNTLQNNKASRILDLGAGLGNESLYMESHGLTAIKADITEAGLKGQKNAIQASAWRLPFTNNSFDGIHSKDMISHIPPDFRQMLFSEIYRVTKHKASLLLCFARNEHDIFYQYRTSKNNLINIAQNNGFVLENSYKWKPNLEYNDWYKKRLSRYVLEFKKNTL